MLWPVHLRLEASRAPPRQGNNMNVNLSSGSGSGLCPTRAHSRFSGDQCSTSGRPFEAPRTFCFRQLNRADSLDRSTCSRHSFSRGRLRCNAATLTRQPLSIYNWPRRRSQALEWLDSCVQDAVRQLDSAPFVQLVYSGRAKVLETHHVPRTATGPSELWQSVAGLLTTNKPDAVILVHRLPSFATEHACASQQTGSSENVLTGLSSHEALDQRALQHDISSRNQDILAGKVGDCCDDEHQLNQILPFSRQHSAPLPATGRTPSGAHQHTQDQTLDYWGLVVQSRYTSEAEGCYVLKTVRNTNPVGCQCTHYSLTRLCKNKPSAASSS